MSFCDQKKEEEKTTCVKFLSFFLYYTNLFCKEADTISYYREKKSYYSCVFLLEKCKKY